MLPAHRDELAALFRRGPVAVISGAGLSTGSGIPAYRDRHGQWQHAQPVRHQDFLASPATRRRYWARSFAGWPTMAAARPNPAHAALAALEAAGKLAMLITQNVDGLHHAAGSRNVIELHGALREVCCLSCAIRYPRSRVQAWLAEANPAFDPAGDPAAETGIRSAPDGDAHLAEAAYAGFQVPDCPACGGLLKPDVVFFGDNVPRDRVAAAAAAVEAASSLLVAGSSLMVYSGYRFAEQAHRLGKPVVAINQGAMRADPLLSLKVDADCTVVLPALATALAGGGDGAA